MKRRFIIMALLLPLCVTACNSRKAPDIEIAVFASSSMQETLERIAPLYKKAAPNVKLTFNFNSSGALKNQIQKGIKCDIFIPAAFRQMDQLDITSSYQVNTDGLDFVLQGTRVNILENRVALCVPEGNPAGIVDFTDWANKLSNGDILFAMGNSEVAVGQYTRRIFSFFKLNESALADDGRIKYGSTVQEIARQIKESNVSCGVIYCTDAYSEGLEIVDYATVQMCGQVIYPAAVMKPSSNPDEARAFLDYLQSGEAMAVFIDAGFTAIQ